MSGNLSVKVFEGNIHKLGDDINTDYIISSRRKRDTLDLNVLKDYIFEDIDPDLAGYIRPGDILAAGENFGCGSAMEVTSFVIKASGIDVVMAGSFARTFYRNGINGGLLLIECETDEISASDRVKVEMGEMAVSIRNLTKKTEHSVAPPGGILLEIYKAGGLVNYIRENRDFA